jgi:hypothetical protein
VLICMINNVLDMGRNVLFIITICRFVLFVWALCVSWLDSMWNLFVNSKKVQLYTLEPKLCLNYIKP